MYHVCLADVYLQEKKKKNFLSFEGFVLFVPRRNYLERFLRLSMGCAIDSENFTLHIKHKLFGTIMMTSWGMMLRNAWRDKLTMNDDGTRMDIVSLFIPLCLLKSQPFPLP